MITRTPAASRTLRQRAAYYFGLGNTSTMHGIKLGQGVYAWVTPTRIWIYDESITRTGTIVNLSDAMRRDLIAALEGS